MKLDLKTIRAIKTIIQAMAVQEADGMVISHLGGVTVRCPDRMKGWTPEVLDDLLLRLTEELVEEKETT